MERRLNLTRNERNTLIWLAFVLPFVLALLVLSINALGKSFSHLHQTSYNSPALQNTSSTLDGVIYSSTGVSIEAISAVKAHEGAVFQKDNSIILTLGGSSSCELAFDGIDVSSNAIKLSQYSYGETPCTDDFVLSSFLITGDSPLTAQSILIEEPAGHVRSIPVENSPIFEGTTLDGEELVWGDLSLREIDPQKLENEIPALELVFNATERTAVKHEDNHVVYFVYGGASSCPINFISMNRIENEIQLISRAGDGKSLCSSDFKKSYFELRSELPIEESKIRVMASEYPDQTVSIPFDIIVFD